MKKPRLRKRQANDLLESYREIWQRAMAAIGAGQSAQDPISELTGEFKKLQKTVAEADHLLSIAVSADAAAGKRTPQGGKPALLIPPRPRSLTQSERSDLIKKVARGMTEGPNGEVNIRDVAKEIASRGVDLGTAVPGTMIGNVLNKADEWERREKGVYKFVGEK